jgi:acetylornithine deacetylase/succinyl-diaminopimelate desuccinylase-like protein
VPDEEPGGALGTRVLLERGELAGDFALVAEPTELRVYRAQKGNIFARLTVDGVSAHGSMPRRGVNAISRAVRLVLDLEEVLGARLAGTVHPLVGPATLNVGTIEGGTATNVVPDRCVVSVDRRVLPGESAEAALAELMDLVGDRAAIEVTHMGASFETPETHPLVVAAQAALTAVTGRVTPCGGLVGSSDARFYADGAGIPTILLGPGSMDQAHVADEYVEAAAVETCVEVFVELALGLLGGAA